MDEEVEIILQQDSVEVTEPLVADYILPTASSNTLGGVKIGDNISIDSTGHISVPTASSSDRGVVKVGSGLAIDTNGILSLDTSTIPQATKNSLGVVYVDDELNTTSLNPVQNGVVSLELAEIDGTVSGLSTTITNLGTSVTNLGTSVTNLTTSLSTLSDTVTNQGNRISTNEGNITTIHGNIVDINNDITDLGNGMAQYQGYVDPLLVNYTEEIDGTDIDNSIWTNGDVRIYRRGRTGIIYINLDGDLTITANTDYTLYTIADSDNYPTIEAIGIVSTDDGVLDVVINTSGEIVIYNNTNNQVHLSTIKGNVPVVWL